MEFVSFHGDIPHSRAFGDIWFSFIFQWIHCFSDCSYSLQKSPEEDLFSIGLLPKEWPDTSQEEANVISVGLKSWDAAASSGGQNPSQEELDISQAASLLLFLTFLSKPRKVTSDWLHSKGVFWVTLSVLRALSWGPGWIFWFSSSSTGILGTLSKNRGEGQRKDFRDVGGSSAKYKLGSALSREFRTWLARKQTWKEAWATLPLTFSSLPSEEYSLIFA